MKERHKMNSIAQARIEKKINWAGIAVMIGLVANLCAGSWFASSLSSRVEALEVASVRRDGDHELLARMDERTRIMAQEIGEIKKQLSTR